MTLPSSATIDDVSPASAAWIAASVRAASARSEMSDMRARSTSDGFIGELADSGDVAEVV